MLAVTDARAAADWYTHALGATLLWDLGSVVGLELLGAPFFLMERLDGCRVPADSPPYTVAGWVHDDATPEQRRTLVESGLDELVKIHGLNWRALGLDFDITFGAAHGPEMSMMEMAFAIGPILRD